MTISTQQPLLPPFVLIFHRTFEKKSMWEIKEKRAKLERNYPRDEKKQSFNNFMSFLRVFSEILAFSSPECQCYSVPVVAMGRTQKREAFEQWKGAFLSVLLSSSLWFSCCAVWRCCWSERMREETWGRSEEKKNEERNHRSRARRASRENWEKLCLIVSCSVFNNN